MSKKVFTISSVIVYMMYAYVFGWEISASIRFFEEERMRKMLLDSFACSDAVMIILFGLLICGNIYFKQKRSLLLNCFLVSALLFLGSNMKFLVMASLFMALGLLVAYTEMQKRETAED